MNKLDYFKLALAAECYRYPKWVFSVFGVIEHTPQDSVDEPEHPYQIVISTDHKQLWYFDSANNRWDILQDYVPGESVLKYTDDVVLPANLFTCLKTEQTVKAGNALLNAILIEYPFKGRIAYMAGKFNVDALCKEVANRLMDDPEEGKDKPDEIYVKDYIVFQDAATYLEMFAPITTVGPTESIMTVDPRVIKLRDELLAKHKDELHDLAILAMIEKKCVDLDREIRKGDLSEKFLISSKSVDIERKKLHIMYGLESGFGTENILPYSLMEGFKVKDMPSTANSIRVGSYSRGMDTAKGGVEVKRADRAFRSVSIRTDMDCGTTMGIPWKVLDVKDIIGRYLVGPKPTLITDDNAAGYLGKTILLRTPARCQLNTVGNTEYCHICCGKQLSARPNAVHVAISDIGSSYMNIFMKAMHGKATKTKPLDLARVLS